MFFLLLKKILTVIEDITLKLRRSIVPLEWTSLGEEAANEIEKLRQRITDLEKEKDMWEKQAHT